MAFVDCCLGIAALAEANITFFLAVSGEESGGIIHARTVTVIVFGIATEFIAVVGAIFTLALEAAIPAIVV